MANRDINAPDRIARPRMRSAHDVLALVGVPYRDIEGGSRWRRDGPMDLQIRSVVNIEVDRGHRRRGTGRLCRLRARLAELHLGVTVRAGEELGGGLRAGLGLRRW